MSIFPNALCLLAASLVAAASAAAYNPQDTFKDMEVKRGGAVVRRPLSPTTVRVPDPRELRKFQGVPGIAVAANGRMWAAYYAGTTPDEDRQSTLVLATSGDGGRTWKEVLVADPDGPGPRRAFDGNVFIAPNGRLWWYWCDRLSDAQEYAGHGDTEQLWLVEMDAENEPASLPKPRFVTGGLMLNKPTVLANGSIALPVAHWWKREMGELVITEDGGKTFKSRGAACYPKSGGSCTEHLFVEKKNGDIVQWMRCAKGIAESVSKDGGRTWSETREVPGLRHTCSRFAFTKLASGRWLMVKHGAVNEDCGRTKLMAFLSDDEGQTWKGGLLLGKGSYPDAWQTADGKIYVIVDRTRCNTWKACLCWFSFTEDEILAGGAAKDHEFMIQGMAAHESYARWNLTEPLTNGFAFASEHWVEIERGDSRTFIAAVRATDPKKPVLFELLDEKGGVISSRLVKGARGRTLAVDLGADFKKHHVYTLHAVGGPGEWCNIHYDYEPRICAVTRPGELKAPFVRSARGIRLASDLSGGTGTVSVDAGRQLFVDNYVIGSTDGVVRHWYAPTKAERPVLRPTAESGTRVGGCTVAVDGGLWWDPKIRRYRLWYESDWQGDMRYAESEDGLAWTYPDLGRIPGTNRVFDNEEKKIPGGPLDTWSVWPDYKAADPYARWNLMISASGYMSADTLFTSADGRRFTCLGVAGNSGDCTTMYFDAILNKWVFSLRDCHWINEHVGYGRTRRFHAQDEFKPQATPYRFEFRGGRDPAQPLKPNEPEIWRELDEPDFGFRGSLYNFNAVPYESLMLGVMKVLHATPRDNTDGEIAGLPKQTSLRFAFSRDGRRYVPAPESAIKPEGWGSGAWDTGYLASVGGVCTVDDEHLRIYYSALRGDAEMRREKLPKVSEVRQGTYHNGAIGYATLRRDGFAGLVADGAGEVVTRTLAFTGAHLFVNAECLYGEVSAEIIGADGRPFPGFAATDCRGLKFTDRTKAELVFAGGSLATLADRQPRIRFKLHCATLFSFWISPSERGESRGYVAAGGPAYPGLRDL